MRISVKKKTLSGNIADQYLVLITISSVIVTRQGIVHIDLNAEKIGPESGSTLQLPHTHGSSTDLRALQTFTRSLCRT